jgi:predicted GNAT superfamily acetyltransferase
VLHEVENVQSEALSRAMAALAPEQFGFRPYREGWLRTFPGLGEVAFAPLGWQHAQSPSYDYVNGEVIHTDVLNLLVRLQQRVWGFPPELTVPTNILAIIPDGGGMSMVAYQRDKGCNADGWLGFVIGLGARSGTLVSHMLGVREEMRGVADLGWYVKLLQAYHALSTGHTAMTWTFDPMRGANARLNLEKLGATVEEFTIDKYGVLTSALYGDVPSDRFTAHWDLLSPRVHERLRLVYEGRYQPLTPADLASVPEVTSETLHELREAQPPKLRYRIAGDIDELMRVDQAAAIRWRQEMRHVLSALLTTKTAHIEDLADGPIATGVHTQPGRYHITGFATAIIDKERLSYYVLERKTATGRESP